MSQPAKTSSSLPPILLLHGFRGTELGVKDVAEHLRTIGFTVHTPNLPPFGGAPALREYNLDAYADYVKDYLQKNDIKKPVLIGHSMGSIVAAATAERYPELFPDQLILMSPIVRRPAKFFVSLQPLITIIPNNQISWLTTNFLFIPKDRELYKKALDYTRRCGADCISKAEMKKAANFSATIAVCDSHPKQQITIIAGEKDRLIPARAIKEYAMTNSADCHLIKNAGHLINYECPENVATLIADTIIKPRLAPALRSVSQANPSKPSKSPKVAKNA